MNNKINALDLKNNVITKITELENHSRKLELDYSARNIISHQANEYINKFIESLPRGKAFKKKDCTGLKKMRIENDGKPFELILDIIKDEVDQSGINSASGCHLGYIPGGGIWSSAVADLLAAAANRYAGIFYSSPGAVIIENQLIKWLCSVVGYPAGAHGNLTSGGSIANLTAIQVSRDSSGINSDNVKKASIYLTQHAHHSIKKALHITGLHEAVKRIIRMNSSFQMDTEELYKAIKKDKEDGLNPFLVIATAGTTDTGAIDPLDRIADICAEFNLWFHVDAAYGGFFILVEEMKEKFKGIERSDSLVMDPHKSLFIPYGSGMVLIKNKEKLLASNLHNAAYMQDSLEPDELNPSDCGIELSKHFRGLRLWLPLHLHGLDVFRANLFEKLLLAEYFYKSIKKLGFETGPPPELSIILFRFPAKDTNKFNRNFLNSLLDDGRAFFSSTLINGEFWIRCAVLSFRSHLNEINLALAMIETNLNEMKN